MEESRRGTAPVVVASRTYQVCSKYLLELFEETGEPFQPKGDTPSRRFDSIVVALRKRLADRDEALRLLVATGEEGAEKYLDAGAEKAEAHLLELAQKAFCFDDISPNQFMQALASALDEQGYEAGTVLFVRELCRLALNFLEGSRAVPRRIYVVESNFWRMSQYVEEVCAFDGRIGIYSNGRKINTMKVRTL